jgi:hypothetical protein
LILIRIRRIVMENRKMAFGKIGVALFLVMFTMCGQDPEDEPEFKPSEYRIRANETAETLNIEEPRYIHSSNAAVVTARIVSGDIIITSTGRGGTSVFVGDSAGLSNSARIDADVDAAGNIKVQIQKFDGHSVRAVIKQGVTINGSVGNEISQKQITLMMDGTDFIAEEDTDASSWIINLPPGLSAIISYVQAGDHPHEVYITVSGTPQSAYSEALQITIPAANSARNWDVYVETRADAIFAITE